MSKQNPLVYFLSYHWQGTVLSFMNRIRHCALTLLSGVLLALAFPKINLSLLAWVAFVPLFWIIREKTPRQAFAHGWLAGMGFYLCTVYWVVETIGLYSNIPTLVAIVPLLMMCAILASYTGAFAAGLRFYQQRNGSILLLGPPLWVALEWLRSFFFIGFPWVNLGYSQHPFLNLIQFAEITGVYGISALVILGNLVSYKLIEGQATERVRLVFAIGFLILALSSWGAWRQGQLAALSPAHHLRVGLIQGNIPQDQKWDKAFQEDTITRYEQLSRAAVAKGAELVIWPETAVPFFFQSDILYQQRLLAFVREIKTPLLFGAVGWQPKNMNEVTLFNRAYLVSATGEVLNYYDKIKLAPFGEYIPFHSNVLFFLDKLVEGIGDFAAGTEVRVFSLPTAKFGVLICFEGIFPDLARRFVANGGNFLVNITNDAWFGRSSAPYQHLVMEAMRAVENRVPLVRAANTGFSAVVSPDGSIQAKTNLYEAAFLVEEMSWPQVSSFYAQYGDLFTYISALVATIMLGYGYYTTYNNSSGR
jgi:apolipoprotein N-acyltransferase